MVTISMLDLRMNAKRIIERAMRGERMILTYRGKPVVRLEPLEDPEVIEEDPFYGLDRLADERAGSVTNDEIDEILYGA